MVNNPCLCTDDIDKSFCGEGSDAETCMVGASRSTELDAFILGLPTVREITELARALSLPTNESTNAMATNPRCRS